MDSRCSSPAADLLFSDCWNSRTDQNELFALEKGWVGTNCRTPCKWLIQAETQWVLSYIYRPLNRMRWWRYCFKRTGWNYSISFFLSTKSRINSNQHWLPDVGHQFRFVHFLCAMFVFMFKRSMNELDVDLITRTARPSELQSSTVLLKLVGKHFEPLCCSGWHLQDWSQSQNSLFTSSSMWIFSGFFAPLWQ